MITDDDFQIWKEHPVTRLVMDRAIKIIAEADRQWNSLLSATGSVDKDKLTITYLDLRARKQALESFIELKLEEIQEDE